MAEGSLVLKLTGVELTLGATANTVGGASFLRVLNANTTTYAVITQQNIAANTANTTYTLGPGKEVFLAKAPADTLTANLAALVLATSVKRF
jgi:hypothetical protein